MHFFWLKFNAVLSGSFFLALIIWQIILFIKNSSRLTSSIHSHHYYRHRPIFISFFIVIYNMLNNFKNENFFYLKVFVFFCIVVLPYWFISISFLTFIICKIIWKIKNRTSVLVFCSFLFLFLSFMYNMPKKNKNEIFFCIKKRGFLDLFFRRLLYQPFYNIKQTFLFVQILQHHTIDACIR